MEMLETHYLYPSNIFIGIDPCLINTVLGSCVAVCLWDIKLKIGGMNHYMLPLWNGQGHPSPKYGNIAIPKMIKKMASLGSNPNSLNAKIFGGGDILETNHDFFHIGSRNIQIAVEMLQDANIPIIGKSVGGTLGRKIQFDTKTGTVRQKMIQKSTCNV